MATDYERKEARDGLTLKLYRGEGACLLAFDLTEERASNDFVGFTVEVQYPGSNQWRALHNRLHFVYPSSADRPNSYSSRDAPFQKFRWIHVPSDAGPGEFRYRVTARYMQPGGSLLDGPSVENAISLEPHTVHGFLNVGFTRGFASSQAYATRFDNETGILPLVGASAAQLEHDMAPFEKHYEWLGFEARRLVLQTLDQVEQDASLTVDALIYECKEPNILRRLEAIRGRLRAIIDDHGDQGEGMSAESISAERLQAAGAAIKRMHLGRQQHNKILLVRRNGKPIRVLTGSTNFSLRGFYIQANNALVFEDETVAGLYGKLFDHYWKAPSKFRNSALAQQWWIGREIVGSKFSFCFSPHKDSALSLDPIAKAIEDAETSVFYAVVFLNQLTGAVRDALDDLMQRSLFSYGVAQRTGGLAVHKPDGSRGLLPFAYLAQKAPEPFKSEWSGDTVGHSNMVHHKFLVTDFNGDHPKVFTGSSNMAKGGETANGDNLICIEDRKIAIAYAIEAVRLFDHFHFRVSLKAGDESQTVIKLAIPPEPGKKPWFASYYRRGHVKERDRQLFVE